MFYFVHVGSKEERSKQSTTGTKIRALVSERMSQNVDEGKAVVMY